ncbi:MAG: hypothetical protein ACSLFP_04360 [Acidimicrobiales bacterium]
MRANEAACGACQHAMRTYKRGRRPSVEREDTRAISTGRLPVTCWCERDIVNLPVAMVQQGLTASCGRPNCHAPKAA